MLDVYATCPPVSRARPEESRRDPAGLITGGSHYRMRTLGDALEHPARYERLIGYGEVISRRLGVARPPVALRHAAKPTAAVEGRP